MSEPLAPGPSFCVTSGAVPHLFELQFPLLGGKVLELLLQETEDSVPLHQEKTIEFHSKLFLR